MPAEDIHPAVSALEVHTPYRWTPADATARALINIGATNADDVGCMARQQDNGSVWTAIATGTGVNKWLPVVVIPSETRSNKGMAALATANDGDQACATAVAFTPAASSANGGYFGVAVDKQRVTVGDGTKTGADCYFSGDGGTTPRAMKAIVAGDLLYWQGSVALFELETVNTIDFFYLVDV